MRATLIAGLRWHLALTDRFELNEVKNYLSEVLKEYPEITSKAPWLHELCFQDTCGLGPFQFFLNSDTISDVRTLDGEIFYTLAEPHRVERAPIGILLPNQLIEVIHKLAGKCNRRLDEVFPTFSASLGEDWEVEAVHLPDRGGVAWLHFYNTKFQKKQIGDAGLS